MPNIGCGISETIRRGNEENIIQYYFNIMQKYIEKSERKMFWGILEKEPFYYLKSSKGLIVHKFTKRNI